MLTFLRRKNRKKDELIGVWENDLDDGSGLHAIWGWSFRFDQDNTGKYSSWSEGKLQDERPFYWQRLGERSIRVRYRDNDEWSAIEYSLAVVKGPYRSKLLKLTNTSTEGFWHFSAAVFKSL